MDILHKEQYTYLIHFLEWEMFHTKFVEKLKKHTFSVQ